MANPQNNATQNNVQQRLNNGNGGGGAAKLNATTPNGTSIAPPSFVRKQNARDKEKERADREKLVLWRQPIQTLKYCLLEIVILMQTYRKK